MSASVRRVIVTGAGGFIGRKLVDRLCRDDIFPEARIVACDVVPHETDWPQVDAVVGDLADPAFLVRIGADAPEVVFHLAGILGGAAEANPILARTVNIDATMALFDALRRDGDPPRVVFASSIAVFGPPLPDLIDDNVEPHPTMIYGAHKRMGEIALGQASARGWIDGIAIRLPGIVARADADARQRAAFINLVFHAVARGEDMTLPVPETGTTWMISVPACVDAFVHAATLPRAALGQRRACTLPAQRVAFGDLVRELRLAFPDSGSRIDFAPDAELTALFASQPPLATPLADGLGFRHDGVVQTLIRRALEEEASGADLSDRNGEGS